MKIYFTNREPSRGIWNLLQGQKNQNLIIGGNMASFRLNLSRVILLYHILGWLALCVTGQHTHSVLYQKISVPRETFANLNKTLVTIEGGVKQCGYICAMKKNICNIFRYDKVGHICTFGKVRTM